MEKIPLPKDYLDRDGFEILPNHLYALINGGNAEYFIPTNRPSIFKPIWYFFRLNGTNKEFFIEDTKELELVENLEYPVKDLTKRLEKLKKITKPSGAELKKRKNFRLNRSKSVFGPTHNTIAQGMRDYEKHQHPNHKL